VKTIKAGIIGGAGYTGGELLRILIHHPGVEIAFVHSRSHAGRPVVSVHTDLIGDTDLEFVDEILNGVDVLFSCLGHGETSKIIGTIDPDVKVIDLGQDFRTGSDPTRRFIYGLPELQRKEIVNAPNVANPGCFATAIQLALLPLASNGLLNSDITISCTTGSTGAGQAFSNSSHFSWRQNNLSVYKAFTHQHLAEIEMSIRQLQAGFKSNVVMIPQRGAFARGILACVNLKITEPVETLGKMYESYYRPHPFVHISKTNIDLKQVVNTNKCVLYLEKHQDQLMVVSVIDNLLKGASGQAVQNMNLLFGLEETAGLKLKAAAF
jgi:N-acetyl-gamma-glutamyl-phosphate reductase